MIENMYSIILGSYVRTSLEVKMFQTYYQIVRSLHKTCTLMTRKRTMPGIRHQLNALENADDLADDPESFEEMESDFMHLNKTHRQHEAELRTQQDRIRQIMVKNKYFRDQRLPNLLFYAEKEEMRSLHDRDPDEWTFERLAESFPATAEVVKKVVRGQWRPYSAKRIREHDEAVIQNWERVKNDKDMLLPAELREHLLKFAARTLNHTATDELAKAIIPKLPTPKRTEFLSIITSCKKYAEKPKAFNVERLATVASKKDDLPDAENETYLLNKVHDKRRMRLEDWQQQNMKHFEQLEQLEQSTNNESELIVAPENPSGTAYIEKFESNEIVINAEDSKRYEMSTYKEQIHIPRKLWRKGGTYRVEDCYYDDDGEFLYRVPGMSGTQHMENKKNNSSKYK